MGGDDQLSAEVIFESRASRMLSKVWYRKRDGLRKPLPGLGAVQVVCERSELRQIAQTLTKSLRLTRAARRASLVARPTSSSSLDGGHYGGRRRRPQTSARVSRANPRTTTTLRTRTTPRTQWSRRASFPFTARTQRQRFPDRSLSTTCSRILCPNTGLHT